ncbi:MAG: hypothetical protein JNN15_14910 [Blastocatellia bacterium]|nr:hypothetical protein [Blastocatellia bacterium]
MVKNLTSREYDALVQRLERMADGIGRHKEEKNFPAHLNEEEVRSKRASLEAARAKYESFFQEASKAYDEYKEVFDDCNKELSKCDDTIRGFYGRTNPVVPDFGTKPFSIPVGRIKKPAPKKDKESE